MCTPSCWALISNCSLLSPITPPPNHFYLPQNSTVLWTSFSFLNVLYSLCLSFGTMTSVCPVNSCLSFSSQFACVHVCILSFVPLSGDCGPPGSSVHGIYQARILEWGAVSSSRGLPNPGTELFIFCLGRQILYHWTTWEAILSANHSYSRPLPPLLK